MILHIIIFFAVLESLAHFQSQIYTALPYLLIIQIIRSIESVITGIGVIILQFMSEITHFSIVELVIKKVVMQIFTADWTAYTTLFFI